MRNPQGTEDVCVTCGKVISVVDDDDDDDGTIEEGGGSFSDHDEGLAGKNTEGAAYRGEEELAKEEREGIKVSMGYKNGNDKEDDGLVQIEKDISGLLADKMMKGWALLSEHCPRCVFRFSIDGALIFILIQSMHICFLYKRMN